jgi:hypothetical protein
MEVRDKARYGAPLVLLEGMAFGGRWDVADWNEWGTG